MIIYIIGRGKYGFLFKAYFTNLPYKVTEKYKHFTEMALNHQCLSLNTYTIEVCLVWAIRARWTNDMVCWYGSGGR